MLCAAAAAVYVAQCISQRGVPCKHRLQGKRYKLSTLQVALEFPTSSPARSPSCAGPQPCSRRCPCSCRRHAQWAACCLPLLPPAHANVHTSSRGCRVNSEKHRPGCQRAQQAAQGSAVGPPKCDTICLQHQLRHAGIVLGCKQASLEWKLLAASAVRHIATFRHAVQSCGC